MDFDQLRYQNSSISFASVGEISVGPGGPLKKKRLERGDSQLLATFWRCVVDCQPLATLSLKKVDCQPLATLTLKKVDFLGPCKIQKSTFSPVEPQKG